MFQSHNGAIAALRARSPVVIAYTGFNPTMVRLLLGSNFKRTSMSCRSFNPTMVRLLLPKGLRLFGWGGRFNPTMVRLLLKKVRFAFAVASCFNPTMVRLLHEFSGDNWTPAMVSIPQWCDCCLCGAVLTLCDAVVSIPQWCDCCALQTLFVKYLKRSFNPTMVRLLLGLAVFE